MRRLLLALATVMPLFAMSSAPAEAWGWGYRSYGYNPFCRPNYYTYRPAYGYAPYTRAYWRPRYYTRGYFSRPYRPWGWRAYRPYRAWGWRAYRPYRAWGWRAYRPYRAWGWRAYRPYRAWGWRAYRPRAVGWRSYRPYRAAYRPGGLRVGVGVQHPRAFRAGRVHRGGGWRR